MNRGRSASAASSSASSSSASSSSASSSASSFPRPRSSAPPSRASRSGGLPPLPLFLFALALVVLAMPATLAHPAASRYLPQVGDRVAYDETIVLNGGTGNYSGYTENGVYNGSLAITKVLSNGTESANYYAGGTWSNNQGSSAPWSEHGAFTFSADTFLYVQGTDNQTGYVNPTVWFYMNNVLGQGQSFYSLGTSMNVVSTSTTFATSASSTGYAKTIFTEGNGSYLRNDAYGKFTAQYNWKEYFDPTTGYVVGYVYTEQDTDGTGDGFTWTDTLTDTSTSFALTTTSAPVTPAPQPAPFPWMTVVALLVVLLVVVLVVVLAVRAGRARRHASPSAAGAMPSELPRHSAPGAVGPSSQPGYGAPTYGSPAPINLIPRDQPPVQQIVMRETVKVPCRYCGTLIDSTATVCPQCGAPRS